MSSNQLTNLIKMVNQISSNSPTREDHETVQFVVRHMKMYWARDMKRQIVRYANADGDGLSPVSMEAVKKLGLSMGQISLE